MTLDPRQSAALAAALDRVAFAAGQASERAIETLGLQMTTAPSSLARETCSAAQRELGLKRSTFNLAFLDSLREQVARATLPREEARGASVTDWQALSLVEHHEVEALVGADRLAQSLAQSCEWELRDLDTYMGALLRIGRADRERNPLRPETIGRALFSAIEVVSKEPEVNARIAREITRLLGEGMRECYTSIIDDLQRRGIQPVARSVKTVDGPGTEFMRNTSGYGSISQAGGADSTGGGTSGYSSGPSTGGLHSLRGGASALGAGSRMNSGSGFGVGPAAAGTPMGHVDAQMMALMRQLAGMSLPGVGGDATGGDSAGLRSAFGPSSSHGVTSPGLMAANLIHAHRDALKQASSGALDHMVIDVVGSLFDQILSDPKVPPQMARQIGRLQLPVLRAALGDPTFFSSRRHPVRRFVNRIASLACAFDDFDDGPGKHFLGLVRDLVQEIVSGDFDQMELYESKLGTLEAFIADQVHKEVQEQGNAASLFDLKEGQLRQQQRYVRQLKAALESVGMQEFMRDFLAQVWSQAIVMAARRDGADGELARRLREAGRELVLSVQPKGTPAERKEFLVRLPTLMKQLNEGLALIGWPEAAKKDFFAQLLPAHAESLKGQSMRQLDRNLLTKQLDGILNAPLPSLDEAPRGAGAPPVLDDVIADNALLSTEEAEIVGLVSESAVDWDGKVDIDLTAEAEISEVDINIDGLPPPEPTEPSRGASLVDHMQLGFAYQMHLEKKWQKVRLAHVSPSRAFFVFTRGKKHQKTISMTQRMVSRMCDTGRLRAFENAYLLERATARARKQLAELVSVPGRPATPPAGLRHETAKPGSHAGR
jgi:hypothetical protein